MACILNQAHCPVVVIACPTIPQEVET